RTDAGPHARAQAAPVNASPGATPDQHATADEAPPAHRWSSCSSPPSPSLTTSALKVLRRPVETALAPAVRVHDASGGIATTRYCVVQGVHRETCLHPVADRVAHDPAGEHVLDRAEVELPLIGPVL